MKLFKITFLIIFLTISYPTLNAMWEGYNWEPSYETPEERAAYREWERNFIASENKRLEELKKEDRKRIKSAQEIAANRLLKKWLKSGLFNIKPNIINTDLNALNINLKNFLLKEIEKEKSFLTEYNENDRYKIKKLNQIATLINKNLDEIEAEAKKIKENSPEKEEKLD